MVMAARDSVAAMTMGEMATETLWLPLCQVHLVSGVVQLPSPASALLHAQVTLLSGPTPLLCYDHSEPHAQYVPSCVFPYVTVGGHPHVVSEIHFIKQNWL